MGCETCSTGGCETEAGGCGTRKAAQQEILQALVQELYPTGNWGELSRDWTAEPPIGARQTLALAEQLATALKVPVYIQPGGEEDLCDFLYVLCVGREPGIVELREGLSEEASWLEADRLRERYLRIALSSVCRAACVQEVAMELDLDPETPGTAVIKELALPGVFDPQLMKRMQKTVDLLLAHQIDHLDMGLLDVDAAQLALRGGDYAARYGTPPAVLNFLFYAQPVQTQRTSYLWAKAANRRAAMELPLAVEA